VAMLGRSFSLMYILRRPKRESLIIKGLAVESLKAAFLFRFILTNDLIALLQSAFLR